MSDFTITREQLRSLTDPKVKEMFPDAFKNILKERKWYKSEFGTIGFCENLINGGPDFTGYCVSSDGSFNKVGRFIFNVNCIPATKEEVFDALKRAAIKMGYKKGLYCVFGKDKHIRAIEDHGFRLIACDSNALVLGSDCIFQNGEWVVIVNKNLL
jgi:hypothetical protein